MKLFTVALFIIEKKLKKMPAAYQKQYESVYFGIITHWNKMQPLKMMLMRVIVTWTIYGNM